MKVTATKVHGAHGKRRGARRGLVGALGAVGLSALLAAYSASSAASTTSSGSSSKTPILIGASLSLSGDFSTDGQAYQRGYELWAKHVDSHGGILGRQVKLDIISDNSDPAQVATNYQKLITIDHVDLIIGPAVAKCSNTPRSGRCTWAARSRWERTPDMRITGPQTSENGGGA
jgi:hypothetical protein